MRLIDAEEVKQDIYKYIKEEGRLINPYHMLNYIDNVKTKEAIPIEYIEKIIKSFDCEEGNKLRTTWVHVLKSLIEFWEFENGEEENEKSNN